jgi:hypothetical protein
MGQKSSAQLPWPVTLSAAHVGAQASATPHPSLSMSTTSAISLEKKMRSNEPWKYEGYQEFSQWMASDDDLFVFRRFASVNARIILWMQHQIVQKEDRLEELHKIVINGRSENHWRNDSFGWDAINHSERDNLMRELSSLVLHYSKYSLCHL